jgi:hypothetical protein
VIRFLLIFAPKNPCITTLQTPWQLWVNATLVWTTKFTRPIDLTRFSLSGFSEERARDFFSKKII